MSDTPIWDQTVWDLLIDPDESLEMYQAYSDLKFMKIDIVPPKFGFLGTVPGLPWVMYHDADLSGLIQDIADRYRER